VVAPAPGLASSGQLFINDASPASRTNLECIIIARCGRMNRLVLAGANSSPRQSADNQLMYYYSRHVLSLRALSYYLQIPRELLPVDERRVRPERRDTKLPAKLVRSCAAPKQHLP
jgi:hypothetical protein